jgi:membrane-associated phospholipid phosphatase
VNPAVDGVVTAGAASFWLVTELLRGSLAPDRCRWCDRDGNGADSLNGFDAAGRGLRWATPATAKTLSDVLVFGLLPAGAVATSIFTGPNDHRAERASKDVWLIAESVVLAGATVQATKFIFARERPEHHFGAPTQSDSFVSFFSGHTSSAFAMVTSTAMLATMRRNAWAPVAWGVGGALAATAGYLRIAADKHYMTDVLVGAAVGTAFGVGVPLLHGLVQPAPQGSGQESTTTGMRLVPYVQPTQIGLSGTF